MRNPAAAAIAIVLIAPGWGCRQASDGAAGTGAGAAQAVPVVVGRVVQRDMPELVRTVGNVEPFATVTLKPQIDGQLMKAHFVDGDEVKAGELMFSIDARPFQAALAEAKAALARDQAMSDDADRAAQQMLEALQGKAMSQRDSDKAQAAAAAARAQVAADRAAMDATQLELEYCSIHSPIDGRTGSVIVKAGNVVEKNSTELVTINQVAPIYVTFAVPEQHLSVIRAQQAIAPLGVDVTFPGEKESIRGTLAFIDNRVDSTTGTVRLKATFANVDRRLWPGQFVNVELTVSIDRNAVVAPAAAVQTGQKGQYVYVVKPDKTVEQRPVTVRNTISGQSVISAGLTGDETVVTEGHLRLVPGATVEMKEGSRQQATGSSGDANSRLTAAYFPLPIACMYP